MRTGTLEVERTNQRYEGTLIVTESVLLNPNRNPDKTREQVEESLIRHLGVKHLDTSELARRARVQRHGRRALAICTVRPRCYGALRRC